MWYAEDKKKEVYEDMDKQQYICPKCDIQNKKFVTVSCTACGYTELYKQMNSTGMDILDFLIGS